MAAYYYPVRYYNASEEAGNADDVILCVSTDTAENYERPVVTFAISRFQLHKFHNHEFMKLEL